MIDAIVWKYGLVEGLSTKGSDIVEWPYGADEPTAKEIASIVSEYTEEVKKDELRKKALSSRWQGPFDLIDDILERGVEKVKEERDKIKKSKPKGKKGK